LRKKDEHLQGQECPTSDKVGEDEEQEGKGAKAFNGKRGAKKAKPLTIGKKVRKQQQSNRDQMAQIRKKGKKKPGSMCGESTKRMQHSKGPQRGLGGGGGGCVNRRHGEISKGS